ncbi:hypothetical protein ACFL39_02505, partial [Gemmatimonadota bacterium]
EGSFDPEPLPDTIELEQPVPCLSGSCRIDDVVGEDLDDPQLCLPVGRITADGLCEPLDRLLEFLSLYERLTFTVSTGGMALVRPEEGSTQPVYYGFDDSEEDEAENRTEDRNDPQQCPV